MDVAKEKVYLYVPYGQRSAVKEAGASWDKEAKKWYVFEKDIEENKQAFANWLPKQEKTISREERIERLKDRVYLNVHYLQKEKAKEAGAVWDKEAKQWYVSKKNLEVKPRAFAKWLPKDSKFRNIKPIQHRIPLLEEEKVYLHVPYGQRSAVKEAGGWWDKEARRWYVSVKVLEENKQAFASWLPKQENTNVLEQSPAKTNQTQIEQVEDKVYLHVPYGQTSKAKAAGVVWDKEARQFYVSAKVLEENKQAFASWLPKQENTNVLEQSPAETNQTQIEPEGDKIYLYVPFDDIFKAIEAGAVWDGRAKQAYVSVKVLEENKQAFANWLPKQENTNVLEQSPAETNQTQIEQVEDKVYLYVPYSQKSAAKEAGAVWDKEAKQWYVSSKVLEENMLTFSGWLQKKERIKDKSGSINIESHALEAFRNKLVSYGFALKPGHPIADGQIHRAHVSGDSVGKRNGYYRLVLGRSPVGFIGNFKTSFKERWFFYENQRSFKEVSKPVKAQEFKEPRIDEVHEKTAKSLYGVITNAKPLSSNHAYLDKKGLGYFKDLFISNMNNNLMIPLYDVNGKIWSVSFITEDGSKRFAKNSLKTGNFHVVNGFNNLKRSSTIYIAEGYATAATITKSLGESVVVAFDSSNLKYVAVNLRKKFPDREIVICGDDDYHNELRGYGNAGKEAALAAAALVNGKAIFPSFGDNKEFVELRKQVLEIPKENLSDEKNKELIKKLGAFTDFNDLFVLQKKNLHILSSQIKNSLNKSIEKERDYSR